MLGARADAEDVGKEETDLKRVPNLEVQELGGSLSPQRSKWTKVCGKGMGF